MRHQSKVGPSGRTAREQQRERIARVVIKEEENKGDSHILVIRTIWLV